MSTASCPLCVFRIPLHAPGHLHGTVIRKELQFFRQTDRAAAHVTTEEHWKMSSTPRYVVLVVLRHKTAQGGLLPRRKHPWSLSRLAQEEFTKKSLGQGASVWNVICAPQLLGPQHNLRVDHALARRSPGRHGGVDQ